MNKDFEQIKKEFLAQLHEVTDLFGLEQLEQRFFSRKSGELTQAMKNLKDLGGDAKKKMGQAANILKREIEARIEEKRSALRQKSVGRMADEERIDLTQPSLPKKEYGHIHPVTQARWQLEDLALSMGFLVEDGPELESDYYVFTSLNIPPYHPARDAQDTFYIKGKPHVCMRSHVSNMQVRLMQKYGAPLRAVKPGKVFRNEALDAIHGHTFYQFDAIVVDKGLSIGHLVGVIKTWLEGVYQKKVELRLRPAYFPFVEPGFEMDMKVSFGKGKHLRTTWVEIVGCGMIHPNVIKEGGLDPKKWDGFAFSFGLDRLVMSKYGIEDIRHFHSGNLAFLKQF